MVPSAIRSSTCWVVKAGQDRSRLVHQAGDVGQQHQFSSAFSASATLPATRSALRRCTTRRSRRRRHQVHRVILAGRSFEGKTALGRAQGRSASSDWKWSEDLFNKFGKQVSDAGRLSVALQPRRRVQKVPATRRHSTICFRQLFRRETREDRARCGLGHGGWRGSHRAPQQATKTA